MKNLIAIIILLLLLNSCAYWLNEQPLPEWDLPKSFLKDFEAAINKEKKFSEVMNEWAPYIKECGQVTKTPIQTINDKGGDCEDKTILFLYAYYVITGDKGVFIVSGINGIIKHTYCKINGKNYYKLKKYPEIIRKHSFDEAMKIACYY